jgi:hypothetical protein
MGSLLINAMGIQFIACRALGSRGKWEASHGSNYVANVATSRFDVLECLLDVRPFRVIIKWENMMVVYA